MIPLKYKFVNWVDGMKISKDHFIALERAVIDLQRDSVGFQLNNLNYGILPSTVGGMQPLEIFFSYDHSVKKVTIKVNSCFAVTPAGARIEIFNKDLDTFGNENNLPKYDFEVDGFNTLGYDIILTVNPFGRIACGLPDPEESPLRSPYIQPAYSIEVVPYPRIKQPEQGPYQLTIGRIEFESGQPKLSKQYIPPCASIQSSSHLISLNTRILKNLDELESILIKIIQKKRSSPQISEFDQETCYVAEKLLYFLVSSKDQYKLMRDFQPPHVIVDYNLKLSRILYTSLECSRNKFELLDYYCNWLEWNPGRFENTLNESLQINYNHEESFKALKQTEECYELILSFFEQIWKMTAPRPMQNTPKPIQKNPPRNFGWLIDHTKGKEKSQSQVFKLDKQKIILGRGSEDTIDIKLDGDRYVSRKHAELILKEDSFLVTDLQSRHGTMVQSKNSNWIIVNQEGFYLMDGDIIQLGKTILVFRSQKAVLNQEEAIESVERMPYTNLYEFEAV